MFLDGLSYRSAAAVVAAIVVGGMALFTFVLAPTVFRELGRERAGSLMASVFPQYYLAMAVLTIAATGLLAIGQSHGAEVAALAAVAFGFVMARRGLLPRMEEARAAANEGHERARATFRRLHGTSMVLNLVQMIVAAVVAVRLVG